MSVIGAVALYVGLVAVCVGLGSILWLGLQRY